MRFKDERFLYLAQNSVHYWFGYYSFCFGLSNRSTIINFEIFKIATSSEVLFNIFRNEI